MKNSDSSDSTQIAAERSVAFFARTSLLSLRTNGSEPSASTPSASSSAVTYLLKEVHKINYKDKKAGEKMKDSIMTLSDIEEKDVINVVTGERIGFVSSLRIDTNSGQIIAITVQPSMRFVSFFSKDESAVVVPWNQILKIGEDVIIVNVAQRLNEY